MGTCIVVELGGDMRTAVLRLWDDLERRWGITRVHPAADPHLTLAVLRGDVRPDCIRSALEPLARTSQSFRAAGAGYGVFVGHGHSPVLHLAVTRTPAFSALHELVVAQAATIGAAVEGEYQPEHWRPHITLADGGLSPDLIGQAMSFLVASGPRHWTVTVDNVAVITDEGEAAVCMPIMGQGRAESGDVRP